MSIVLLVAKSNLPGFSFARVVCRKFEVQSMGLSRASDSTLWSCILHCARIEMDIRKGRGFACFAFGMGDCGIAVTAGR